MGSVDAWKNEIRALLPRGFLRISRDSAFLFVSDYPKHLENTFALHAALAQAGFEVTVKEGVAFMDGGREKYARLVEAVPPVLQPCMTERNMHLLHLARVLMGDDVALESQDIALIRQVMRCTALRDEQGLMLLPRMMAERKRKKQPLAPVAGMLLWEYLNEKESGKV